MSVLPSGMAAFVLAGIAPALVSAQRLVPAEKSLVFDGVTVVDVEDGRLLSAQRVVIAGHRIRAVGPMDRVPLPPGARVVDARGKYLIPGLWDMHAHPQRYAESFYWLFLANGVTGFRDAGSELPLDTLRQWRQEILAGTRAGPPRQVLSGKSIDGGSECLEARARRGFIAFWGGEGHVCASDTVEARRLVDSLQGAGADMLKTYYLPNDLYFAVTAEARRVGIPFGGHLQDPALSARTASDRGARIIDHLGIGSARELDTLCVGATASLSRCEPVAERLRRNGTWLVPTLNACHDMQGPRSQAIDARLDEVTAKFWADSLVTGNWLRQVAGAASAGSLTIARRARLPILAGTDVSNLGNHSGKKKRGIFTVSLPRKAPGFVLHAELAMLVAEGLSPVEALQSATLNPAKLLHATDSLGTVAPGKLADLVLLDADPLADITNTTTVRAVVANGRYFDRAALDQLLAEVRTKAKQEPREP